jgi:hypothetical protein
MKNRIRIGIAAVMLTAADSHASPYYVATNGVDVLPGGTAGAPFASISFAAAQMSPGDTCIIRGGTYHDSVVLPVYGLVPVSGTNWLEYVYRRRTDRAERDLVYRLIVTTNLVSGAWTTNGVQKTGAEAIGEGFESVTNRLDTGSFSESFMRLRIEQY